ncbi:MAG TPA: hypothetical protein VFY10_09425 [Dehalococcoidia bacterium]|nr:hypothetical protein [Dehalococcoidia bacterium]
MATTLGNRWASARTIENIGPVEQTFWILRVAFTVAPIVFGLDKFTNLLVDWSTYLAPWVNNIVPGSADQFMYVVGVVEIAAGLLVAFKPSFGGLIVAGWLAGIIVNLLTFSGYYDVALRDFGLLLGALALSRLAFYLEARTDLK